MNPIAASGATPPRCNGGVVLNNNRKRSRNEFEAGGLYQVELPLHHRPFGHRPQVHGHFNGLLSQHESLNPPPLAHQLPQPLGYGIRQPYNNSILNPPPLPQQQPQPLSHGVRQPYNNSILNPPPLPHQQPQPLSHGVRQPYNNSILNPPPLPQQQPQPLGYSIRQPYNNSILNPPPLPQQQPQLLNYSIRQLYNNSILNPPPLPQQQSQPLGHSTRQPYNNSILNAPPLPHQQPPFLPHQQPQPLGYSIRQPYNKSILNPPPLPHQQPQPLGHGGPLLQYSNNSIVNPPYKPQQPLGHDVVQQDNNSYLSGSLGGFNIPSPRGQLLEEQDHQLGLSAPPFNELQKNSVAAVLDQQPHVQDNQPKALDKGDIVDWGHLWNLQVLLEDQDILHEIDEQYNFQDWELPHLPDGGVPQQQYRNDLLFDDVPDNNPPNDGSLDIARWPDWDPLDEDVSDEDQSDEAQSDEELSQDGEDGLVEDNNFHGLQHNPNLKICDAPGCIQPTFHQTLKARKCRLHLENPVPQSRLQAPGQAATAGQDFCSGCNGLHPRRAPGRTCWECYCKGRGRRLGVCDGCPASRCPNRVVEGA